MKEVYLSFITYLGIMNVFKVRVYKQVLKEIYYKYDGAEDFINERIEVVCFHEKLSIEKVIYF